MGIALTHGSKPARRTSLALLSFHLHGALGVFLARAAVLAIALRIPVVQPAPPGLDDAIELALRSDHVYVGRLWVAAPALVLRHRPYVVDVAERILAHVDALLPLREAVLVALHVLEVGGGTRRAQGGHLKERRCVGDGYRRRDPPRGRFRGQELHARAPAPPRAHRMDPPMSATAAVAAAVAAAAVALEAMLAVLRRVRRTSAAAVVPGSLHRNGRRRHGRARGGRVARPRTNMVIKTAILGRVFLRPGHLESDPAGTVPRPPRATLARTCGVFGRGQGEGERSWTRRR